MKSPILRFLVNPSYRGGFFFSWDLTPGVKLPDKWQAQVESSQTGIDDFVPRSPVLIQKRSYHDTPRPVFTKDQEEFFRVKITTTSGSYLSEVVSPFASVSHREFFLVRELMRKEQLAARILNGVTVHVYKASKQTDPCPVCLDPVTGRVLNPDCPTCSGTGTLRGYHGPYETTGSFSPRSVSKDYTEDGAGTDDLQQFQLRLIAQPLVDGGDILVDLMTKKRYAINSRANVAEVKRIPVVQAVDVVEVSPDDIGVYNIGVD